MRPAFEILRCSVRGCVLPLERVGASFGCARGHAFDVARAGHVNLLQPQDRRSLAAGDAKEVLASRLALEQRGVGAAVDAALADLVRAALGTRAAGACAIDLGAGTGARLARLAERLDLCGLGLDLSAHAVEGAAKRHPALAWCVANCDRALPVRDASVDVVLSVDARRPAAEARRVLRPDGVFVVAVPGAGDLAELRGAVLQDARELVGLARVDRELADLFDRVAHHDVEERHALDQAGLADLSRATYRAGRRAEAERLARLDGLVVTVVHEIGVYRPRAR